jgi:hypothetical protein
MNLANMLGMTHVYFTEENISLGIKISYTGPVIKVA